MKPQSWISCTYPRGGAAGKETSILGAIWLTLRDTADVRRSCLSYLPVANERMKVICLEM